MMRNASASSPSGRCVAALLCSTPGLFLLVQPAQAKQPPAGGTPGGSRTITMVRLGMLGIEQGLDPQQISALPRIHHQYLPDAIFMEPGALPPETVRALNAMGHEVRQGDGTWGNMQAVDWDLRAGTLRGGSDPRNPVGSSRVVPTAAKQKQ